MAALCIAAIYIDIGTTYIYRKFSILFLSPHYQISCAAKNSRIVDRQTATHTYVKLFLLASMLSNYIQAVYWKLYISKHLESSNATTHLTIKSAGKVRLWI